MALVGILGAFVILAILSQVILKRFVAGVVLASTLCAASSFLFLVITGATRQDPLWIVGVLFLSFYAFCIALVVGAPFGIYRRRRFARPLGHCWKCGYDLTGNVSGRCPECGTATPVDRPAGTNRE